MCTITGSFSGGVGLPGKKARRSEKKKTLEFAQRRWSITRTAAAEPLYLP